jgi:hypothetical protein
VTPNGYLLLSASPYGEIERIISAKDQKPVPLGGEDVSTPARIELAPGAYTVTVSGPGGSKTVDVNIEAGKNTKRVVSTGDINIDQMAKDFAQ